MSEYLNQKIQNWYLEHKLRGEQTSSYLKISIYQAYNLIFFHDEVQLLEMWVHTLTTKTKFSANLLITLIFRMNHEYFKMWQRAQELPRLSLRITKCVHIKMNHTKHLSVIKQPANCDIFYRIRVPYFFDENLEGIENFQKGWDNLLSTGWHGLDLL